MLASACGEQCPGARGWVGTWSESSWPRPSPPRAASGGRSVLCVPGEGAAGVAGERNSEQKAADAVHSQDFSAAGCFDLILFEGFLAP